ncbi:MAG TPA: tRNA pseudouridine(13) synthase TruD [Myxococcota bacterium]|nr:tRNA pseudouridine(13) synthase TruD [Myxococcota bacterium]
MRARLVPEDFAVEEIPLYAPTGEGEHTFVWIEKRLRTTEEASRDLARAAGVAPRDVGYAGRKDRFAVARQTLSVPGLDPERALGLSLPGVRVLAAARHPHKLRTAQLRGNRFALRLRELDAGLAALEAALAELAREGLPNRFGEQRYGSDGRNAERGRDVLLGRTRPRDRREARFLVSALQAAIFDEVLARRPRPLRRLEGGDVAVVHASGGLFVVDDAAREQARADAFEISATGPIVGGRERAPGGGVARREAEALARFGLDAAALGAPPRGLRLRGARRALRVRPAEIAVEPGGPREAWLRCVLPPGSYASVLLAELATLLGESLALGPVTGPEASRTLVAPDGGTP